MGETHALLGLLERAIYGPLKFKAYAQITFNILRAVDKKSTIFWNLTPCFSLKINLHCTR
jgi:hypothetical protein